MSVFPEQTIRTNTVKLVGQCRLQIHLIILQFKLIKSIKKHVFR